MTVVDHNKREKDRAREAEEAAEEIAMALVGVGWPEERLAGGIKAALMFIRRSLQDAVEDALNDPRRTR